MNYCKLLILVLLFLANNVFANLQLLDKIAVVINNDIILESNINKQIFFFKLQAKKLGQSLPNDNILRHQIIEKQITDNIILQIAKKDGLKVNSHEIDDVIKNIINYNKININELYENLANNQISYDQYRKQIKKEILINKTYEKEISNFIKVSDKDIKDLANKIYLQEHIKNSEIKISYILIPIAENFNDKQINNQLIKANQLINKLKNNKNFNDLKLFKNINIEWSKIDNLPKIFANKLKYSKKGDIIGPIKSGAGFYILKVNDLEDISKKILISEIKINQIMLRTSPILNDYKIKIKLKKFANIILQKKSSFEKIAKKYSEDFNYSNKTDNLGWISLEIFDKNYHKNILKLKKGQISNPIHSKIGWHLIQLIDKRTVDKTNEMYKEKAYKILYNRKFIEFISFWRQEQRSNAYLNILDSNV